VLAAPASRTNSAKLRSRSGSRDRRRRLAAPDQRARIRLRAGSRFGRDGFTGEHRLIELHVAVDDLRIRRNDAAEREFDDVVPHERSGGNDGPRALTAHRCVQCESRFQRGQRRLGTARLDVRQSRIEHQQRENDSRLQIFVQHELQDRRRFEQPRHGRPERPQDVAQRMVRHIRDGIRPVRKQALCGLGLRETGWFRIHAARIVSGPAGAQHRENERCRTLTRAS